MDIALMIEQLVPSSQYGGSVTKNTKEQYEKIRWQDSRPKPTWEQLEEEWEKYSTKLDDPDAYWNEEEQIWVLPIEIIRQMYIKEIDEIFPSILEQGFTYEEHTIQADEIAQNNLTSYMSAISAAVNVFPLVWRTRENTYIWFYNIYDFNLFGEAMLQFKQTKYLSRWNAKDQINVAQNEEEILTIYKTYIEENSNDNGS